MDKDKDRVSTHCPSKNVPTTPSMNEKMLAISAKIAVANDMDVEVEKERKKDGIAQRSGRTRPPISRKGSRKADEDEGWEDYNSTSADDEDVEGEWEWVQWKNGRPNQSEVSLERQ